MLLGSLNTRYTSSSRAAQSMKTRRLTATAGDGRTDTRLDLDKHWWRDYAWLPLLAAYLLALVLWLPAARLACWVVLWVAYTTGQTPDPPPAYTAWGS